MRPCCFERLGARYVIIVIDKSCFLRLAFIISFVAGAITLRVLPSLAAFVSEM